MKMRYDWVKNYLFVPLAVLSSNINAQENTENTALKHLDALTIEIRQTLTSNTLAAMERDQIYDILGSLGICRPVARTVLEHALSQGLSAPEATSNSVHPIAENQNVSTELSSTAETPHQATIPTQPISSMDMILNKFDALKQHLIQQLADNKIEAIHRESAYTLIGSINLCRPILKGADLLSEKMKAEASKDQSVSAPTPEHSIPDSNPSSDVSGPIAS